VSAGCTFKRILSGLFRAEAPGSGGRPQFHAFGKCGILSVPLKHRPRSPITQNRDELAWCFQPLVVHYRRKDEGVLSSSKTAAGHLSQSSVGARPVTGHVCARFFVNLPADAPVHPFKISAKSLFWNVLHVTSLFLILCTGSIIYLHENKRYGRRGEGVPPITPIMLE
jgi:hypothetical protein